MSCFAGPNLYSQGVALNIDPMNPLTYPGSGTTIYNTVGSNTGIIYNGALVLDNCFYFDGVDDYLDIDIPYAQRLLQQNMTLCFWSNIHSSEDWGVRFDTISSTSFSGNGRYLWYNFSSTVQRFHCSFSGITHYVDVSSADTILTNNWRYVCLISSDSNNDGVMRVYIDGEWMGSTTVTYPYTYANSEIFIMSDRGIARWANGSVGSVMIYDRVLTQSEILTNYMAQRSRYL